MATAKQHNRQRAKRGQRDKLPDYRARRWFLMGLFSVAVAALCWRAVDQQIFETDFLQNEGQRRYLRVVEVPAHRGVITDRVGEPLAVSTPVDSVYANPRKLTPDRRALQPLAELLDIDVEQLQQKLARHSRRGFVYLKRRVNPDLARQVESLGLPGVGLQREYRRYYPSGEVTAHLIGFTDIDDQGQEGLELAYDDWLRGITGSKRVIRDALARTVKDVESIREPRPGKDLALSIDRRLQFLAYRELKAAVRQHNAISGSAVLLDVRSGEVLAMVNQPAYNPNGHAGRGSSRSRNRAITDVFEPGSTIKPLTVAAALETGRYKPNTLISTTPGTYRVGRNTVRDIRDYGTLDVAGIIRKSSNVGVAKIALSLPAEHLWSLFSRVGFGSLTQSTFPGEAEGQLTHFQRWRRFDQAVLAFGYGLSVTPLQLASAYAVLAADGVKRPVSVLRNEQGAEGERVMSAATARAVRRMMEAVVSKEGTAPRAAVPGYRVAGKTGTVKKSIAGGYAKHKYLAVFAGMAPASDPRLVLVVMINEPRAGKYYGGQVAAPVFSRIMTGALRLLNVPPDAPVAEEVRLASLEGER
jgi:cell division protein FtsI (penicillin-binding protein 3)